MKWSFTTAQTEALKEFLFENNFDRTPLRETCFRKGYEMGFSQAQSELTHIAGAQEEAAIKDVRIAELEANEKVRKCFSCGEMAPTQCGCKLLDQITELQKKCRAADELAGFYGDESTWSTFDEDKDLIVAWEDSEKIRRGQLCAGKRARQFQKDYPKTEAT